MSKSYMALTLVIVISVGMILVLHFLQPHVEPTTLGFLLAFAGVATFAGKFAIADLLSNDGFDDEKAAVDLAFTLATALFGLAAVQSYDREHVLFPSVVAMVDGDMARATAGRAIALMWGAFALSAILFVGSLSIARRLRRLRFQAKGVGGEPNAGHWLSRLAIQLAFTVSYGLYFITVLYKA
ncbi:hypothetical protein [Sphingomonas sp. KR3-1]|uniref:hypothetical protein n=1 Tax=Sphingomonas sp. KR3-1 TaxID=3156611 RepID=UPI0032B5CD59